MSYKAVVRDGQVTITNLEKYPNETVLEFELVQNNEDEDDEFESFDDDTDDLDDEQRAELHAALDEGLAQARRREFVPVEEVLKRL